MATALQQQIPHNHCFGCGPGNPHGLRLESHWADDGSTVAEFRPRPWHSAAPPRFVNGGIIAARIVSFDAERVELSATLAAAGRIRAEAEVIAVRVPETWMQASRRP